MVSQKDKDLGPKNRNHKFPRFRDMMHVYSQGLRRIYSFGVLLRLDLQSVGPVSNVRPDRFRDWPGGR